MVNRRLLSIILLILFVSVWGFNYYQLNNIQSLLLSSLDNNTTDLNINWIRKAPSFNTLEVEMSSNGNNFIIDIKPAYFSKEIYFTMGKDAKPYITKTIGIDADFDNIEGKVASNPTILTLTYHGLRIVNQPLSVPSANGELPKDHQTYSISAKKDTISLSYSSFESIFDAPSKTPPMMLTYEVEDLNIDNSFSIGHLLLDTLGSNDSETKYHMVIDDFQNIDSKLLLSMCNAGMQDQDKQKLFCNEEVLSQILPINIDMHTAIDNIILLRKPENGKGYIKAFSTTPILSYQLDSNIIQTAGEFLLNIQNEILIHDADRLQKLYAIIDPENTFNHELEKATLSLKIQSNLFSLNPMFILFNMHSLYTNTSELTTAKLKLDRTKNRYYHYPGIPEEERLKTGSLNHIGTIKIGHKSWIGFMSRFLGFEVPSNSTIDVYQDEESNN